MKRIFKILTEKGEVRKYIDYLFRMKYERIDFSYLDLKDIYSYVNKKIICNGSSAPRPSNLGESEVERINMTTSDSIIGDQFEMSFSEASKSTLDQSKATHSQVYEEGSLNTQ